MDTNKQPANNVPGELPATEENTPKTWGRRELLKALAATGGAVALSNVPNKWDKPEVGFGVLPAHAQASDLSAPIYDTQCDSQPGGGSIGVPGTGIGQINQVAARLIQYSTSGNIANVNVVISAIPVAGPLPTFNPTLPTSTTTNSLGVANIGTLDVTGIPGLEFNLQFVFETPDAIYPTAICGTYRLPLP